MSFFRAFVIAGGLLTASCLLAACDGDDPVTAEDPEEVAGLYSIAEFRFQPDADPNVLRPVNLLDTLSARGTMVELTGGGQFLLRYQFTGGQSTLISGDFDLTSDEVVLNANSSTASLLNPILLSSPIRFFREGDGTLRSTARTTVNLAAFSRRYQGIPPVIGTLVLRLELQPEE